VKTPEVEPDPEAEEFTDEVPPEEEAPTVTVGFPEEAVASEEPPAGSAGPADGDAPPPADVDVTAEPVEEARIPTIMVVDDSLTVRKITSRLLEREGFQVVTAKDGVDALEQLVDMKPDVMLLDIEMPRMDGFDLARNVRADARLRDIPIIMITSRMADKHRNYAMEIGVNHYLGKPYQEEQLLELIAGFIARKL
jgi:chemosensory pili system protein ChpA (sensor histidine kinase/response regulator)